MPLPPLVVYSSVEEYRQHYLREYCRSRVVMQDGTRVYFAEATFGHCFYESSGRDGRKDVFSDERAKRIDWISATLRDPVATSYAGWIKDRKVYDHSRKVSVVFEDFVVVVALSLNRENILKGKFITSYRADQSIGKIARSPLWDKEKCMEALL